MIEINDLEIELIAKINTLLPLSYINNFDENEHYTSFLISKKSGGFRTIYSPKKELKIVQKYIANFLSSIFEINSNSFGYCTGKNIKDNANLHINKKFIFNIDLKDFFNSINKEMVKNSLILNQKNIILNENIIKIILTYCKYRNYLPQGSPSSPIISNICCILLDLELVTLAKKFDLTYSRYVDDITFSGDKDNIFRKKSNFRNELYDIIQKNKFTINLNKISLKSNNDRQIVTGLIVNKKVSPKKSFIKNLRLWIHWWEKFGYEIAEKRFNEFKSKNKLKNSSNLNTVIKGKLDYLRMVIGNNSQSFINLRCRYQNLMLYNSLSKEYFNTESSNTMYNPTKDYLPRQDLFNISIGGINIENISVDISDEDFETKLQEALAKKAKDTGQSIDQVTYKFNFKKHKNPKLVAKDVFRNLLLTQLKNSIIGNITSQELTTINTELDKLINNSPSNIERKEAEVIKEFLTKGSSYKPSVYVDKENVSHDEFIAILASNENLQKILDKHLSTVKTFIINNGVKIKSAAPIKLSILFQPKTAEEIKAESQTLGSTDSSAISSMFIDRGGKPSDADLAFSNFSDNLKPGDTIKIEATNVEPKKDQLEKLLERYNDTVDAIIDSNELKDDFYKKNLFFNKELDYIMYEILGNSHGIQEIRNKYAEIKKYNNNQFKERTQAIRELVELIVKADHNIPTYKIVNESNEFDKYIRPSSAKFGYFSNKPSQDRYENFFKDILTKDKGYYNHKNLNQFYTAILKGFATRNNIQIKNKNNEIVTVTVGRKTHFKILKTEKVGKNSKTTSNKALFEDNELKNAIENNTIPTFVYNFRGRNITLPEVLFYPSADILNETGYVFKVLKALNPSFHDNYINFFLTENSIGSSENEALLNNQVKYLVFRNTKVGSRESIQVSWQNGHSIFTEDSVAERRLKALENIKNFVESKGIGGKQTKLYKTVKENGTVKITSDFYTWAELVTKLEKEINDLNEKGTPLQETSRNYNKGMLEKYPILSLFLMSADTANDAITESTQFSMAVYSTQPSDSKVKVSINPYYNSNILKNSDTSRNAALVAQQLILMSDSTVTDILPVLSQPIGKRFSTTGAISTIRNIDSISTPTSLEEDRRIKAEVEKEMFEETLIEAETFYNNGENFKDLLNNNSKFLFLEDPIKNLKSDKIKSKDIIFLYKLFIKRRKEHNEDEDVYIGIDKNRRGSTFNGNSMNINKDSFDDYKDLQDEVENNEEVYTDNFEGYQKFFELLKAKISDKESTKR